MLKEVIKKTSLVRNRNILTNTFANSREQAGNSKGLGGGVLASSFLRFDHQTKKKSGKKKPNRKEGAPPRGPKKSRKHGTRGEAKHPKKPPKYETSRF